MAKKRRAAEQALGVPVNKRKSLLMKPRHYSPNVDCKEDCDDRTEAEEEEGFPEASGHTTTGNKGSGSNFIYSQAPKTHT